ncbi:MAG: hypothetical protein Q4F81_11520 [Eubacteriales bacterium]|nr:hypothetical protein [Eubacteriales bacterium]
MKISKLASAVFAAAGTILLVGSVVLCAVALNRPSEGIQPPEGAEECARAVLEAIDGGDFSGAAAYLYGQPSLGLDREPATEEGRLIWDAYRDSAAVTACDGCYSEGTDIFQTAEVTAMDVSAVMAQLDSRAAALLKQELDAEEDSAELLDENGELPRQRKDEIETQALRQALAEPETVTRQITFQLIEQDSQWWVVPDQAMLDILSGGLS